MRFLLLIAALVAAPSLHAQRVTLAPFPAEGTFSVTTTQDMTMDISLASPDSALQAEAEEMNQTMKMSQASDATLTVTRRGAMTHITLVNDRIRMTMEMPGDERMSFDSSDPESAGSPMASAALWIGTPIAFRFDGDSLQVLGLDSLIHTVMPAGDVQEAQRDAFAEMFGQMIGANLDMLPAAPVGSGESFDVDISAPIAGMGAMRMRGTWAVSEVAGTRASFGGPFTVEGEVAAPGMPFLMTMTGQGTYDATMDTATGDQENTTDMQMEATMDFGALSGGETEGVMTMKMAMVQTQTTRRR